MWDIIPYKRSLIAFAILWGMMCALELRSLANALAGRPLDSPIPNWWKIIFAAYCGWLCYEIARFAFRGARTWEAKFMASFAWFAGVGAVVMPIFWFLEFLFVDSLTDSKKHPLLFAFAFGIFGAVLALLVAHSGVRQKARPGILGLIVGSMFALFLLARAAEVFGSRLDLVFRSVGSLALLIGLVASMVGVSRAVRRRDSSAHPASGEPSYQVLLNRVFLLDGMRK